MKGFAKLLILSFIFAAFALSAYITFAATLPDTFHGTLKINNVDAPGGTEIRAEINGNDRTVSGPFLSSAGSYAGLGVGGLDDEVGQTIIFRVKCSENNFVAADQNGTFLGGQNVELGLTVTCQGVCIPTAEVCDGIDNNCDGAVDEGNPDGGQQCSTGLQGVCSPGTTVCSSGSLVCNQNVQSSPEVCDNLDNDCDGVVDENNPGGGQQCSTGEPGVCSPGTTVCTNGAISCNRNVEPTAEVCDNLDNDCDGAVDENNPGGGVACNTGLFGVCSAGTTACTNGAIACSQNTQSSPEVCDSLDNDCDNSVDEGGVCVQCIDNDGDTFGPGCSAGADCNDNNANIHPGATEVCNSIDDNCNTQTDETFVDLGSACLAGVGACERVGVKVCSQDGTTTVCSATPGQPTAEICDAIDNNCDGTVDDFSQSCYTGPPNTLDVGVCHAGTKLCTAGSFGACVGEVVPSAEICDNGIDEDCNRSDLVCVPPPSCGNSVVDPGEECDDGNSNNNDACTNACQNAECGDGFVRTGIEQCDDSNTVNGDGCSSACVVEFCGDSITNNVNEQCDNGLNNGVVCTPPYSGSCQYCSSQCTTANVQGPFCGDGVKNGPEQCDGTSGVGPNQICTGQCLLENLPVCGNGVLDQGEACDDGNVINNDSCTNACQLPVCGDNIIQAGIGETCDDGNTANGDGCSSQCTVENFCIIITNMTILDNNFNAASTILPGNLYNVRVSNKNVCQDPITSMQIVQIVNGLLPVNLATVTSTIGSGQTSVITVGFILSPGAVPGNTYTATAFNWNRWIDQPSPPPFQILSDTGSASFTVAS